MGGTTSLKKQIQGIMTHSNWLCFKYTCAPPPQIDHNDYWWVYRGMQRYTNKQQAQPILCYLFLLVNLFHQLLDLAFIVFRWSVKEGDSVGAACKAPY